METNNYTTDLQLVSQEYSDEKTSLQTKTKKLLEDFSPKDIWKIKGLIIACLVACFLYITYLTHFSFAFPATVVLISTIELGCRLLDGKAKGMRLESAIFMVTSLLQGLQISLWGLHDNWGSAQILCLHASLLLYLMARTRQSSQERLGITVWLDLIYTSYIFPLKYFLIGAWTLFGVYMALYGVTPRRLLSGWFVTVLFIWCVLTLIRLYKPIQATRLAVFYATISFTLVSLLGSFIL